MDDFSIPLTSAERLIVVHLNGLRAFTASLVDNTAFFLERHSRIIFPFLILLFLPVAFLHSQAKLLWHDELFTYYVAQAPSISALIKQTQTLDLNPPLSYLSIRAMFHLFHVSATVSRIPSMLGFMVCMWCLYSFVGRKLGVVWGMASALLLQTGNAYTMAIEARPYGLMLGFVSLAFVAWQRATDGRSNKLPNLLLLELGGFGALLSHVFAIFAWMMLMLAELVRILVRRRINWPVLIALLLPLMAVVTYIPLMRLHATSSFPVGYQPSLQGVSDYLGHTFRNPLIALAVATILTLTILGKAAFGPSERMPLSTSELVALLGFLSVPMILILYSMRSHSAFFTRYGIVANIALAVLIPVFAGWITRRSRSVALITVVVLLVQFSFATGINRLAFHMGLLRTSGNIRPACEACALANRIAPDLPFVDASGLTFVEMDSREDAGFLSRVFYLTDPYASFRYAHASIFEGMQYEKSTFGMRANVAQYGPFIREHPVFVVLGNYDTSEDWLLKKLLADGAHICLLATVDDTQFKDWQLWQVVIDNTSGIK